MTEPAVCPVVVTALSGWSPLGLCLRGDSDLRGRQVGLKPRSQASLGSCAPVRTSAGPTRRRSVAGTAFGPTVTGGAPAIGPPGPQVSSSPGPLTGVTSQDCGGRAPGPAAGPREAAQPLARPGPRECVSTETEAAQARPVPAAGGKFL